MLSRRCQLIFLLATTACNSRTSSDGSVADGAGQAASPSGSSASGGTAAGGTPASSSASTSPATTSPAAAGNVPLPSIKAVAWPALDFISDPGNNNDPLAVALTFDDGPDGAGTLNVPGAGGTGNTSKLLDVLSTLKMKATFFICSKRATDLDTDPSAQADLKRIVADGHDLANHTVDHTGFDGTSLSVAAATQELAGVQATVSKILGPQAGLMSLYRTPYGKPYQDQADLTPMYAAATAPYGVHVGWGIDSHDWQCAQADGSQSYTFNGTSFKYENTQECVLNNVKLFIQAKQSGVILMHSIYKLSVDVLPQIVDLFKQNGYHFVSVEDFVRAKYGGTSAQLAAANKAANFDAATLQKAAVASVNRSAWVLGTNAN